VAQPRNVSDPILVAAATATDFELSQPRNGVNIAFVFYTDALATEGNEVSAGAGTRDVTVTGYGPGSAADGYTVGSPGLSFLYDGGTVTALAARTMIGVSFGAQMTKRITVACPAVVTPGGSVAYRIWVFA
jgi:hypothetical protein